METKQPEIDKERVELALAIAVRASYWHMPPSEDINRYEPCLELWHIVEAIGGKEAVELLKHDPEAAMLKYVDSHEFRQKRKSRKQYKLRRSKSHERV